MINNKYFCYFVEEDNEKKIVNELKGKYLESGVINKFIIQPLKLANNSYIIRINIWKRGKLSPPFYIIYSIS